MIRAPVEYSTITSAKGPLVILEGTRGDVGWDEFAEIRLASGEMRHGVVLEVDHDLAVVQVMEGTAGLDPRSCRIGFVGSPAGDPGDRGLAGS